MDPSDEMGLQTVTKKGRLLGEEEVDKTEQKDSGVTFLMPSTLVIHGRTVQLNKNHDSIATLLSHPTSYFFPLINSFLPQLHYMPKIPIKALLLDIIKEASFCLLIPSNSASPNPRKITQPTMPFSIFCFFLPSSTKKKSWEND